MRPLRPACTRAVRVPSASATASVMAVSVAAFSSEVFAGRPFRPVVPSAYEMRCRSTVIWPLARSIDAMPASSCSGVSSSCWMSAPTPSSTPSTPMVPVETSTVARPRPTG